MDEPERVAAARLAHEETLIEKVEALGLAWPPRELYVRMFKDERVVEVWVGDGRSPLELLETFSECGASGVIGPKVAQGDLQVPEGFYVVTGLNPWSPGLLSLQLDYPNDADRARRNERAVDVKAAATVPLGGDIAVHGTCISTGCLAIDDAPIEQLYVLAIEPRRRGRAIRVHVFPTRLSPERIEALLEQTDDVTVVKLWTSMIPAYRAFERTHRTPVTWARGDGTYGVQAR
jgi:murein L,D-transpeptidase YafK